MRDLIGDVQCCRTLLAPTSACNSCGTSDLFLHSEKVVDPGIATGV